MRHLTPTAVAASATLAPMSPARVRAEFLRLLQDGGRLVCVGGAKRRPRALLQAYLPRARIGLFDTTFYLANFRDNPAVRFFVAYVVQRAARGWRIHPRIFYKDVSLVWRCASHLVEAGDETWIGKGDTVAEWRDGEEYETSAESTTDLPLELQTVLDRLSRVSKRIPSDDRALGLVLQTSRHDRIAPYAEFTRPRRLAAREPRNLIHRGRPIARLTRKNVPESLVIARGFEPDFAHGVVETTSIRSHLYGGEVLKRRILSTNRRVQYLFMQAPRHVWIVPPQALTTGLSSFGLRTVEPVIDEDLCVPGFEYHFIDDSLDPPQLHSQIPPGFAGPASTEDPSRADASAWLERLPVIAAFRRHFG